MKRNCITLILATALVFGTFPFFASAQSQESDVYLVSPDPVFSRVEIPGGFDGGGGNYPFNSIQWLSGGYFVVNGFGNSNAFVDQYPQAAGRIRESGGMYLIRESDGEFLGARNVVFDTSARVGRECFEGLGCSAGLHMHPLGPNRFVRDLHYDGSFGIPRSPVIYDATDGGFNLVHRLWFNQDIGGPSVQVGDLGVTDDVAVAGGKIIMRTIRQGVAVPPYDSPAVHAIEIYDFNFGIIASFSDPNPLPSGPRSGQWSDTRIPYAPVVGIGDYFIAADYAPEPGGARTAVHSVYKMPSTNELSNGARPQKVQTLNTWTDTSDPLNKSFMEGWSFDAQNPNRIAIVWRLSPFAGGNTSVPGTAPRTSRLIVYEASNAGLLPVAQRDIVPPSGTSFAFGNLFNGRFSVSGDYIVYTVRADGGSFSQGTGSLVVERISTGERLSADPIPDAKFPHANIAFGSTQIPVAVAMSKTGRILVATIGGLDNGNLYLYQVRELGGPSGGGDTPTPDGGASPGVTDAPTFADFGDVTRFYMDVLRKIYGFPPIFEGAPESSPVIETRSINRPTPSSARTTSTGGSSGPRTGFLGKLFEILNVGQ